MDRLEQMLETQRKLQIEAYGHDPAGLPEGEKIWFITWNMLALAKETLGEGLDEVGWKPWASSKHINRDELLGEMVDGWHFLMNILLAINVTPNEFFAAYMLKRELNAKRQLEGYDGVSTKCPGCGRALDDPAVKCSVNQGVVICWEGAG